MAPSSPSGAGRGFASVKRGPGAGDRADVRVVISPNGLRASSLVELGHEGKLELEGIFLGFTTHGMLRLAVVHRGKVFVTVPAGLTLPQLQPGDEIELVVSVDAAGAFTLVHRGSRNACGMRPALIAAVTSDGRAVAG